MARIGFLGPLGTFHEQALLTDPDLAACELVPLPSIPDVLTATEQGTVDLGFVAVENSIEGTVNVTLDMLAFETDVLIQQEVVLNIELHLLGVPGTALEGITRIHSFPTATAQVRGFLAEAVPAAVTEAANSTSEAARLVGEAGDPTQAAVGTALAGQLYGLEVLAADIADHPENQTRFVVVKPQGVPAITGHDKTTIVCFQPTDRPGSLLAILQEFAARGINLTKLESRPTKRALGEYCFIIDLEGHVADEVVADCLRTLKAELADVKFLGSYPAAGEHGPAVRRDADAAWQAADAWLKQVRAGVAPHRLRG
jgi:prephenate dehydratase